MAMDESTFERLAEATLRSLAMAIEAALGAWLADSELGGGVLRLELEDGSVYLLNKHVANREL